MTAKTLISTIVLVTWLLTACGEEPARQESTAQSTPQQATPQIEVQAPQPIETAAPAPEQSEVISHQDIKEIEWDALIPQDWQPQTLMAEYNVDNLSDDDPRAQELMDKLKALWSKAPVVPELDGSLVKLPGFVVPLEMDEKKISQFLLVPYYGACIHVPPPPANQTVHVVTQTGKEFSGRLYDTVWVSGRLRVEHHSSELADSGYRIENATVAPYE
jgi:hypothetical protein